MVFFPLASHPSVAFVHGLYTLHALACKKGSSLLTFVVEDNCEASKKTRHGTKDIKHERTNSLLRLVPRLCVSSMAKLLSPSSPSLPQGRLMMSGGVRPGTGDATLSENRKQFQQCNNCDRVASNKVTVDE
jgi:hypothetical protein